MTPPEEWVAPVISLFGSGREGGAGAVPSDADTAGNSRASGGSEPAEADASDAAPAGATPRRLRTPSDGPQPEADSPAAAPRRLRAISGAQEPEAEEAPATDPADAGPHWSADARPGEPDARDPRAAARERAAERQERRARNVSVAALARRGMSVAELRTLLAERGIEEEEIEAELARLQDARYLDDAALAESVIRTETERKGRGRSAIAAELRRRKVDDAAVEEALASLDDEAERERAIAVAEQRARQLSGYDTETARRRLYGFLQRRGFSGSVVSHAVDTALAARD